MSVYRTIDRHRLPQGQLSTITPFTICQISSLTSWNEVLPYQIRICSRYFFPEFAWFASTMIASFQSTHVHDTYHIPVSGLVVIVRDRLSSFVHIASEDCVCMQFPWLATSQFLADIMSLWAATRIHQNRQISARSGFHTYRDVETAGCQSVKLVFNRTCADVTYGNESLNICNFHRIQQLILPENQFLSSSVSMGFFLNGNDPFQHILRLKAWWIRLMGMRTLAALFGLWLCWYKFSEWSEFYPLLSVLFSRRGSAIQYNLFIVCRTRSMTVSKRSSLPFGIALTLFNFLPLSNIFFTDRNISLISFGIGSFRLNSIFIIYSTFLSQIISSCSRASHHILDALLYRPPWSSFQFGHFPLVKSFYLM